MSKGPEADGGEWTENALSTPSVHDEKAGEERTESATTTSAFDYDDDAHEPELHARTYVAVLAMFLLNMVQVLALQGPPAVVCGQNPIFTDVGTKCRLLPASFHWKRPQCHRATDMDSKFTILGSGRCWPSYRVRLRHFPGPETHLGLLFDDFIHWCSDCTERYPYWSCYRSPNTNWLRICNRTSCILCS